MNEVDLRHNSKNSFMTPQESLSLSLWYNIDSRMNECLFSSWVLSFIKRKSGLLYDIIRIQVSLPFCRSLFIESMISPTPTFKNKCHSYLSNFMTF